MAVEVAMVPREVRESHHYRGSVTSSCSGHNAGLGRRPGQQQQQPHVLGIVVLTGLFRVIICCSLAGIA